MMKNCLNIFLIINFIFTIGPVSEAVAGNERFNKLPTGVVHDTQTGLEWYAGPDNDIDFSNAKRWVSGLKVDGGGWRMPVNEELKTLYQKGASLRNLTPLLKTSGYFVWSEGSSLGGAWDFRYNTAFRENYSLNAYPYHTRVFAVRKHRAEDFEQGLYTAHNIWKQKKQRHMLCINYKTGPDIIPAGTPVIDVKNSSKAIEFKIADTGEKYKIGFKKKWHPGKTVYDYSNSMFTSKSFEKLTADFSPEEIDAIKRGVVIKGMKKEAVIVSYGLPPEHRTPSLSNDEWTYWMTTMQQKKICFDKNDMATSCDGRGDEL